jgi:hypothetical protein
MSSISSKTVIVIDKSYYMCRRVQHALNIDLIVRGNTDESYVQKSPTIYQSALQSLTEYCRIVWDIFGSERRFLLKTFYKNRIKTISSWNNQGMDFLRDTLRRSAQNSPNLGLKWGVFEMCSRNGSFLKHMRPCARDLEHN